MGKFGGRGGARHGTEHDPVEACHTISAEGRYQRPLLGQGGHITDPSFELGFFVDGDEAHFLYCQWGQRRAQTIKLTWTPCRFGGQRKWFDCPLCHRRVGKLYLPNFRPSHAWYCRHCYDLTYVQRQERAMKWWTFNGRAQRIADRWLIVREDKPLIYRPKRQRWKTYHKRVAQYKDLSARANFEIMGGLMGVLSPRIAGGPELLAKFKEAKGHLS